METDIDWYDQGYVETVNYPAYDYRLNTPWTFNVSAGTTVSNLLAVGAEYEFQDYSTSKFKDLDGYELSGNSDIQNCLKGVHTLRLGMEARLAPEFSFRVGYNYSSAAYNKGEYSEVPWYGASSLYNNGRTRNTVTFGLGYRGSVVYADLAYKYDAYKSSFYGVDDVKGNTPVLTSQDQDRHQVLFTLGARF
jgi:long-subunit fatty acid transport protein